jgi:hypothetical protein
VLSPVNRVYDEGVAALGRRVGDSEMPQSPAGTTDLQAVLQEYRTESGRTLLELLNESPILLIFLRHFGCSFCREALDQVSKVQDRLRAKGVRPVFVHLGTPERAKPYFDYYKLSDAERVSNPDASLYKSPAFGLRRTNPFLHLLQPRVWMGWLRSAIHLYGIGLIREDVHQMPGVFFLREGSVVRSFRYRTIADQPDYLKLIS